MRAVAQLLAVGGKLCFPRCNKARLLETAVSLPQIPGLPWPASCPREALSLLPPKSWLPMLSGFCCSAARRSELLGGNLLPCLSWSSHPITLVPDSGTGFRRFNSYQTKGYFFAPSFMLNVYLIGWPASIRSAITHR